MLRTRESAFLASSQVVAVLLVLGPHSEGQRCRQFCLSWFRGFKGHSGSGFAGELQEDEAMHDRAE